MTWHFSELFMQLVWLLVGTTAFFGAIGGLFYWAFFMRED